MSNAIERFPMRRAACVRLLRETGGAWLVLALEHGWLHGDRCAALADAQWLGRKFRAADSRNRRSEPAVSGAHHRRKGDRIEREIVDRHRALDIHAERYPLSGATRFRGAGHDIDVYLFGRDQAPAVAEVKARKDGAGFATLEKWLGEYDALFSRRNNADPIVVLPWRMWQRIASKLNRGRR